jgi:hypothetical protein
MISPEIFDDERLYRSIFLSWWNFELERISAAAFLDDKGVSVDRASDRSLVDILASLKTRFRKHKLKAVASLTARQCRDADTYVFYSPSNNKYHSSIWNSETEILISLPKAFDLSLAVKFDYINETMTN